MPKIEGNKKFVRCTRQVGNLWLVFWDKETVYAQQGRVKVLYHRFCRREPGFYYYHWRQFIDYAKTRPNISIASLNEKAALHEINITVPRHMPILPPWEREEDES